MKINLTPEQKAIIAKKYQTTISVLDVALYDVSGNQFERMKDFGYAPGYGKASVEGLQKHLEWVLNYKSKNEI
ncbi:MAG: hypothetical protein V4714_08175 [Bacteroidota bacterium]